MYAVYGDHKTCVQELLNNNADITAENSNLDTAYSISVKRNFHTGNSPLIDCILLIKYI